MKALRLKYLGVLVGLGLIGCVQIEPMTLKTNPDASVYKPSDYQGVVLKEEVIFDFRGGIGDFWSDKKYTLLKQGSAMKVMCKGPGANYEPFGVNMDVTNFSNAPVLRIRMKLDKKTTSLPTLRLDLRDVNGAMTNAAPCAAVIKKSEDWVEYFFDYNHKWKQAWPEAADVDLTKINGMQFFVNPGGKPYTGTILVDEIYAMANKDGSGEVSDDIVIDNFEGGGDVSLWWPCKAEKVSVGMNESEMKIHIEDGQWDCFGKIFGETDISNTPIIKIRARATSETPVKMTNIMARFIDVNENATDLVDGENMVDLEVGGAGFKNYYSVFRTKTEDNLFSSMGEFDPTKVNRVIIFINMNKESNFTGDILLEEISFVKELPREVLVSRGNSKGPTPTMQPEWPKGGEVDVIDDMKKATDWKAIAPSLNIAQSSDGMLIKAAGAGSDWAGIEKAVTPFNIYDKQFIKISAKADGNFDPELRIDMVDNFGVVSNARPVSNVITKGGDFQDYYYYMKNNFYQRSPEMKIINAMNIQKLIMYVNGGYTNGFTGSVEIDHIKAVSIDDVPQEIVDNLE